MVKKLIVSLALLALTTHLAAATHGTTTIHPGVVRALPPRFRFIDTHACVYRMWVMKTRLGSPKCSR